MLEYNTARRRQGLFWFVTGGKTKEGVNLSGWRNRCRVSRGGGFWRHSSPMFTYVRLPTRARASEILLFGQEKSHQNCPLETPCTRRRIIEISWYLDSLAPALLPGSEQHCVQGVGLQDTPKRCALHGGEPLQRVQIAPGQVEFLLSWLFRAQML